MTRRSLLLWESCWLSRVCLPAAVLLATMNERATTSHRRAADTSRLLPCRLPSPFWRGRRKCFRYQAKVSGDGKDFRADPPRVEHGGLKELTARWSAFQLLRPLLYFDSVLQHLQRAPQLPVIIHHTRAMLEFLPATG